MIVNETISNLQKALETLSAKDAKLHAHLNGGTVAEPAAKTVVNAAGDAGIIVPADTWAPPVIGSPLWFLEEVAEAYGQGRTDYLVDELCGLKVVQREELPEPVLVMADGKWYNIVPEWARRTAEQIQSDEHARRVRETTAPALAPAGVTSPL